MISGAGSSPWRNTIRLGGAGGRLRRSRGDHQGRRPRRRARLPGRAARPRLGAVRADWPLAGWTFDDAAHEAWTTDPALRFLDDAFTPAEPDRTTLHSRAL